MNSRTLTLCLAAGFTLLGCNTNDDQRMVGTLERDRIELKVESDEPITAIHVEDGARLNAGDPILDQDPQRQLARLDAARAQSAQAAARLAELRRGPRQEAIREAQARLAASAALSRDAGADLRRQQEVFERGLAAESDLDDARTQLETAENREQADREALAALLNGTTVEELQQAEAVLRAAEANERFAQLALDRLQITAPLAGRIDRILYEIGERPVVGTTVAILLDGSRSFARIYVPAHLKAQASIGARLDVRIDGVEDAFTGTVRWVSADASFTPYFALTEHDRSRLSYLAEVDIDNADDLPTGLPLEARPAAPAQKP